MCMLLYFYADPLSTKKLNEEVTMQIILFFHNNIIKKNYNT